MVFDMGWTPRLSVAGIRLGNAEWAGPDDMLQVGRFEVSVQLKELLRGRITLPQLVIESPDVRLQRDAEGASNWVLGDAPAPPDTEAERQRDAIPVAQNIRIENARVSYDDATRDFHYLALIQNFSGNVGGADPLRASASGEIQGEPFGLELEAGSVIALRDTTQPYPLNLKMHVGETRARLDGQIDNRQAFAGLDAQMHLEGLNLADLFPVLGVPLLTTPPYKLSGRLRHQGSQWGFQGFTGQVGDSDLAGDFNVDIGGQRMKIIADLQSEKLDFDDLAPIIGAPPDASETASAEQLGDAEEAAESANVIPDTPFDLTALRSADAEVKLAATRVEAPGLPIDDMLLDLSLRNGVLQLKPLRFGVAGGNLDAYATIDASNPVIGWNYDVRMREFALQQLLDNPTFDDVASGTLGGDILLKSRGNSVHEALAQADGRVTLVVAGGTFSNLLLELAGLDVAQALGFVLTKDQKVPIRCVVGDFDLAQGKLDSRTLVVDTADTRIDGALTVNLEDETFKLNLAPKPKDPSPFTVRTPLNLSGRFNDVGFAPDYGRLGLRAGAAVALGLLATPVAALLAFVDPGTGEDADCDSLLDAADQDRSVHRAAPTQ
jgi:AsmA family protein